MQQGNQPKQIAALFVEAAGPYSEVSDCELWDIIRDARKYRGPYPVIAHPPCERWGRYARGGPNVKTPKLAGDDEDCFAAALRAVRHYGGVLEHPAYSKAYEWFGIKHPPREGGWVPVDNWGWACHVEQGHYEHPARKATWLYAVGIRNLPELKWGPGPARQRADEGFRSNEERAAARARGQKPIKRLSKEQLIHTPRPFRDVLVRMVRADA